MTVLLNVPFKEKEKAKKLGAKWDNDKKSWVAMQDEPELVRLWGRGSKAHSPNFTKNAPLIKVSFIGEDRHYESELIVDMPPKGCPMDLKRVIKTNEWNALNSALLARSPCCEICKATPRQPLEMHERWLYDNKQDIRTLKRLLMLCSACHEVTHFNLTYGRRTEDAALDHFMNVTGFDKVRADEHIEDAYRLWKDRNDFLWTDDISILKFSN